jgi:hypothetical protein
MNKSNGSVLTSIFNKHLKNSQFLSLYGITFDIDTFLITLKIKELSRFVLFVALCVCGGAIRRTCRIAMVSVCHLTAD